MSTKDSIDQVVEITGANRNEAEYLLAACANDVQAAIALFFEGGALSSEAGDTEAVIPIEEDEVRAPIAPIREQLVGPEDDNFGGYVPATGNRLSRVQQRVKVCPLRDFAREGALMEQQLEEAENFGLTAATATNFADAIQGGRTSRRARAAAMVNAAQSLPPKPSSSHLGDIFRPPTDIAYSGTFGTARLRATELQNWLLVNVQDDSFEAQLLNRDVWSDKELRKLIRQQFMLWQVDADSNEGRRFVAFYHCGKLPYICVIDPRTGEEMWKSESPKEANVLPDLRDFLKKHKDFSQELADADDTPSTSSSNSSKRSAPIVIDGSDDEASCSSSATAVGTAATAGIGSSDSLQDKKRAKIMELSEQEQIALAIRNSMRENGIKSKKSNSNSDDEFEDHDDDDFGSVEEFAEDEIKSACERSSYEEHLGSATDEVTMLKLRLLDEKGADQIVPLRWPSNTKLEVLRQYIRQCHAHIPKQGYKLICAFPRKTLEAEHNEHTLKEIGLHPSANIHLTMDD